MTPIDPRLLNTVQHFYRPCQSLDLSGCLPSFASQLLDESCHLMGGSIHCALLDGLSRSASDYQS